MKLTDSLRARMMGSLLVPIIIKFRRDRLDDILSVFDALDFVPRPHRVFRMVSGVLPTDLVSRLNGEDSVERVFFDSVVRTPEIPDGSPFFRVTDRILGRVFAARERNALKYKDWVPTKETRRLLGLERASQTGLNGSGTIIAIIDSDGASGRYYLHEQLRGRVTPFSVRRIVGDTNGHGGHVSTTALGKFAVGGVFKLPCEGMAPGAEGLGIKALYTPVGSGMTSDIIAGMEWAIENNATILNLSLGSEEQPYGDDPICDAITRLPEEILVVVAAGNAGPGEFTIESPGNCPDAITVGAWDVRMKEVAEFSSRGPTSEGLMKPDFVMPGVDIYSGVTSRTMCDRTGDYLSDGYSPLSGSSMAVPHMSGLLAVASQLLKRDHSRTLTRSMVKHMGKRLAATPKSPDTGWGMLRFDVVENYAKAMVVD